MLPLQQFKDYIKKNALFAPQQKILLAVSGGKDSVLMAQLFKLANYNFSIAHCNFSLRANESLEDAQFVRELADAVKPKSAKLLFGDATWSDSRPLQSFLTRLNGLSSTKM